MLSGDAVAPSRRIRLPAAIPPVTKAVGPGEVNDAVTSGQISNTLFEPLPSVKEPAVTSTIVIKPAVCAFWPMFTFGVGAVALKIRPTWAFARDVGTTTLPPLRPSVTLTSVPDATVDATS